MEGWDKKNLGSICGIVKGEQLNKLLLEKSGDFPCINGGIEPSGYTDKWNRDENTITISEGGNSCGFINYIRTKFWSGGHCYSILNLDEQFDRDFIYYALKGRESKIMQLRVGSGLPNIQQKAIRSFLIPYPEEKKEQTRIAEILSIADETIEQTEKLIAKYQRIKTGLMQDLLTKGIDEQGNIRSKATHKFVVKKGIEVPEEWEVKLSSEVLNILNGGTPSTWDKSYWENGDISWLSVDDFNNGKRFVSNSVKHITQLGLKNSATQLLPANSLIISARGTVGVIAQLKNEMAFNQSCYGLSSKNENEISNDFLYYALKRIFADGGVVKSGSVFDTITRKTFNEIKICYPQSKFEFNKITDILSKIDNFIEEQKNNLSKYHSIRTGLMQDLLSGKVRVS